ncbi:unknown similar to AMEV028 [Adoxophyes honmai entomopoxvirus 'L']|uniref:Uncharacterized protein n=1 Tax=Adoxophyes honmai entomopoxvirus 'L' TaxID=1293540 RepID=A0A916KNU4_9POXV|nr:unknown similar to AMEV028 [Adoxophyes honmai entomopoxvirus 'L']CCU55352.1 unknown similar to AMEV028 [Adoxophyes honmai entomopoxvirus 'L']
MSDILIYIDVYINNNKYISCKNKIDCIPAIEIPICEYNKNIYLEIYSNNNIPKFIFTNNKNFIIKNLKISNNKCEFNISIQCTIYNFIIGFYIYDILNYIKKYDNYDEIIQSMHDKKIYYDDNYINYKLISYNKKIKYKKIRYIPYYNFYNLNTFF